MGAVYSENHAKQMQTAVLLIVKADGRPTYTYRSALMG
jgi:hypothetical protein